MPKKLFGICIKLFVNSKKYLFGLFLVLISGFSFSKDCEKSKENMAEVRVCLGDELDRQLNIEYVKTYKFILARDIKAAQLLDKAQKSWDKFAGDSCEYFLEARQTGLMANDARLDCRAGFVGARVEILKSYRINFGKSD